MNKLEFSITSVKENVYLVEDFIENLMKDFEIQKGLQANVTLAVVEAVNNSILSGNKGNPDKLVKLTAARDKERIVVTVEDEGDGFDFTNIPDPTTPDNLMKTTGRGLYLMIHLTDELLFAKNGAKVVMTFFLNHEIRSSFGSWCRCLSASLAAVCRGITSQKKPKGILHTPMPHDRRITQEKMIGNISFFRRARVLAPHDRKSQATTPARSGCLVFMILSQTVNFRREVCTSPDCQSFLPPPKA